MDAVECFDWRLDYMRKGRENCNKSPVTGCIMIGQRGIQSYTIKKDCRSFTTSFWNLPTSCSSCGSAYPQSALSYSTFSRKRFIVGTKAGWLLINRCTCWTHSFRPPSEPRGPSTLVLYFIIPTEFRRLPVYFQQMHHYSSTPPRLRADHAQTAQTLIKICTFLIQRMRASAQK